MTTNYQKKTKNITRLLDCRHFFLIGGKKCPQSRIGAGETKMTARWKTSAKRNRGERNKNVRIVE